MKKLLSITKTLFALVSVSMVLLTVSCANDNSSSDESSEENIEYTKENIDKIVSNITYSETAENILNILTSEVKYFTSTYYFNGEENDYEGIVVKTVFGSDNTIKTVAYKEKYKDYYSTGKAYITNLSGSGYYYLNAEGTSIYLICGNYMLEAPVELSNNDVCIGSPSTRVDNSAAAKYIAKNLIFTSNTVINEDMEPSSGLRVTLIDTPDPDEDSGNSGTSTDSSEIASKIEGTWYIKGTSSNSSSDGGTAVFSNGTVTYTPDVNKTSATYKGSYSVDNGVLEINGTVTVNSKSASYKDTFTVSFDEDNKTFTIKSKTATASAPSSILTGFFQRTSATSLTFYSSK